jgi:hypothetical protein
MKKITEKDGLHKEWYKKAENMELKDLPKFLDKLMNDYQHDYGTICHAITAGGLATMKTMSYKSGITGFQAGCIMWEFISNWMCEYKDKPLKLLNYENMLYPQYQDRYEKYISKEIWKYLKKEAKRNLNKEKGMVHPSVLKHWKNIVNGVIPFGYKLKED